MEPAIDYSDGSTVYLLTPDKAPFPSRANPIATAPLYLPLYPLNSTVPAAGLNCQPNNCDHVNVLPFPNPDYGSLPGNDVRCADFNGRLSELSHQRGVIGCGSKSRVHWDSAGILEFAMYRC